MAEIVKQYIGNVKGPKGDPGTPGERGPAGEPGPKGDTGSGLQPIGSYATEEELREAHPSASDGDFAFVGPNYWVWNDGQWVDMGRIQGPEGPAGEDGSYWFVGTDVTRTDEGEVQVVAPVEQAKDGDLYLNTETGDIFRYATEEWSYVDTLSGGGGGSVKPELSVEVTITSTPADGRAYKENEVVTTQIKVLNTSSVVTLYELELTAELGELAGNEGGKLKWDELRPGTSVTATTSRKITQADYGNQTMVEKATCKNTIITATGQSEIIPIAERNVNLLANMVITTEGTGDAGEYYTWDPVGYKLTVQNGGNITLTNIEVAEQLQGAVIKSGDGYTVDESGHAKITELKPDANVPITIEYVVQESDLGKKSVVNTANVTCDQASKVATAPGFDVSSELRTLKVTTTVTNQGTGDSGKFVVGDTVKADCVVKNEGAKTYTDVLVSVTAPEGAKIVQGDGYELQETDAKIASMAQTNEVTVKIEYTMKESDLGKQDLIIKTQTKADQMTIPSQSEAISVDEIKRGLSATVTVSNEGTGSDQKFTTGDEAKFSVVVKNTGNVTLTGVTVTEQLSGATFEDGAGYSQTGAEATIESLAPQASTTLTAKYGVKESDIGNKSLTNSVKAQSGVTETTGTSDPLSIEDEVQNLSVEKSITSTPANGKSYAPEEQVKFKTEVKNIGNVTLKNVEVSEETEGASIVAGTGYELSESKAKIATLPPKNLVTVDSIFPVTETEVGQDGKTNTVRAIGGSANVSATSVMFYFKGKIPEDFSSVDWASDMPEISENVAKSPEDGAGLVGKEKTFTTTGLGTFTAVCVDVAHFEKQDGSGKAGLVFQFKEATSANYPMNPTNTNTGGYPASPMYTTTLPNTILAAMQDEVKNAIVEVKFPYNTYKGSGQGDSAFTIAETHAKLFLPSNREVWGTTPLNSSGSDAGEYYHTGDDGTQFAYWVQHPTIAEHIKKKVGTETAASWWCRSCYPSTTYFVYVNTTGAVDSYGADYTAIAVAPCFCI